MLEVFGHRFMATEGGGGGLLQSAFKTTKPCPPSPGLPHGRRAISPNTANHLSQWGNLVRGREATTREQRHNVVQCW